MKTLSMDMSRFTVKEKQDTEQYEHYINKTAILLFGGDSQGRPKKGTYISVHRMVQRWSIEKIIRHYNLALKHSGDMKPNIYWWWLRKKERANT